MCYRRIGLLYMLCHFEYDPGAVCHYLRCDRGGDAIVGREIQIEPPDNQWRRISVEILRRSRFLESPVVEVLP